MKQILLLICMIPFTAIPAIFLLQIKHEMRNYYLLISFFVNQIFLIFFIGSNPQGVYEGSSIFVNLSIIYSSAVPLLVLCISRPTKQRIQKLKVINLSGELLRWAWISLFILGIYSSVMATTKLMPMTTTFMFGVTLFLIFRRDFKFDLLLDAIYKYFGFVTTILIATYILKFDWTKFSDQTEDILNSDSNTYFSPLATIFGLSPRLSGPFSSGQVAALFSIFGISCFLASTNPKKNWFMLFSLVVFGSFTGSRTFYLTLVCLIFYHLIKKFLPRETTAFWVCLLAIFVSLAALLYKYLLPIISPNTITLTNLTGRTKLWKLIIENWSSEGIFGHGPNTLTRFTLDQVYFPFAHAHNSFLQYLWDFGLLGLFCVLLMVMSLLIAAGSEFNERNKVVGVLLPLILVQTEPTIRVGTYVVGWFWLVPLAYVYSRENETEDTSSVKRSK